MIKKIGFKNFRNLNGKYEFNKNMNVIIGKNSSGKTNLLDGIKLAFNTLNGDYYKINKSDFKDSDDDKKISIFVLLRENAISSLMHLDKCGENVCGFRITINKTLNGKYVKKLRYLHGGIVDNEILMDDNDLPAIYSIPLLRIEDIFTHGLTVGLKEFIENNSDYKQIKDDSRVNIKSKIGNKEKKFTDLCGKFNENLKIEITDPKIDNEKLFVVDGDEEHNFKIGSGYKSVANIMLNTINENMNIILIDEIENHLHPSLIRNLIRELRLVENVFIVATTHSPVVINELEIEEMIDIGYKSLKKIGGENVNKLNKFLHPGRNEMILADNVILVEGYTEEMLLKYYLKNNNMNWTIVNVAGVMFEPYIHLSVLLNKKCIVISDNDKSVSKDEMPTQRFKNLQKLCYDNGIKIIEMDNTLETDLYNSGLLIGDLKKHLMKDKKHDKYYVAKPKCKTILAHELIESEIELSKWHVIKEIKNGF